VTLRVGIVAAEPSGDLLGAGLIEALRAVRPDIAFEGIGGPRMIAAGCASRVPMEKLSVMGLVEVLRHLRELLGIRRALLDHWRALPPDLYVGVDAPDFNLPLERRLRQQGVPTVHYVSPTVWAWRPGRVKTLRAAADLVLSIFPFEGELLAAQGVRARYVGHPLADEIEPCADSRPTRARLGLPVDGPVLAVLPGSRLSEIEAIGPAFIAAARLSAGRYPGLRLVTPLVNAATRERFSALRAELAPDLQWLLVDSAAREALPAADVVLTASGTATLEALLVGRPMVVGYRVHALTYWAARLLRLVRVPYIAMANLLAGEGLAPEFVQGACTAGNLADAVGAFLDAPGRRAEIRARYRELAVGLRRDTSRQAAAAVLSLLEAPRLG
jgi:lipid-A-disaccharide synthase